MRAAFVTVSQARLGLQNDTDVLAARRAVTAMGREIKLRTLECTKVVTAASELARNAVLHGLGGTMLLEHVSLGGRAGLRMTFEDHGPGIADIDRALEDGFSTRGGLGMGLPGARRLVAEFAITSTIGAGTRVVILHWKQ